MTFKKKITFILFAISIVIANLVFGSIDLSLFSWSSMSSAEQKVIQSIVLENRLPRTMLAFFSGAASAIVGLALQTVFKNPLAGPTTLGINSGASLGIVLYFFCISSAGFIPWSMGTSFFAILGALLFLTLTVVIAIRFKSAVTVLIVGLLLGYVSYSFIEILVQSSSSRAISNYVFWGMGSFNAASWWNVSSIALLTVTTLVFFVKIASPLNLYLLGDDELLMENITPKKIRIKVIVVGGLLVGVLTSVVGPLAFLGVAVPNFLKLQLRTLDHKLLMPYCMLGGGTFAVMGDFLSRGILFDSVFPLNAVLSLLAIPIIFVLLLKNRNGSNFK